ncbi:arsenic efflux protein [bacterium]|nr:arsenic efflux protein [bacterium]
MFETIIQRAQEILSVPGVLISHCPYLPEYVKDALITSINFIPWLYFLYYAIELLERFFLKRVHLLIKLMKNFGPIFGSLISVVPECGYSVIASIFYSRKMITRGTLLAFLISCSDDALPLLFLDLSKAVYIIPIVIIKIILGILVAFIVDFMFVFQKDLIEDVNAINIDLNDPGCCHHRISTAHNPPYWWAHPATHTFNMFMFTFLSLVFFNCIIQGAGGAENLASTMLIDSPYQVIVGAIIGLVPNCVTSIFLALAFVKGLISFPTLLAGLVTTTGLGLITLTKHKPHSGDTAFITFILLLVGIGVGLFVHNNMHVVATIQSYFGG